MANTEVALEDLPGEPAAGRAPTVVVSLETMMRRHRRAGLLGLLCSVSLACLLGAGVAEAAPPPGDPVPVPLPGPATPADVAPDPGVQPEWLIPIPVGCPAPDQAAAVFTGTMIGKDDVTQVVRFRIDQLRAGSADPWAVNGLIDVRYGADYRFLSNGEQYLIGVRLDSVYGVPSSTVRPPEPTFGGNDVVGVDDIAVDCPAIDDPTRTLQVDGTSVDSGVLSLMTEDRRLLLATFGVPALIVFSLLLALVVLRAFGVLAFRGVFQLGRAAVTPVPDHRAVRVRTHRPRNDDESTLAEDAIDDDAPDEHAADSDEAGGGDTNEDDAVAPAGR